MAAVILNETETPEQPPQNDDWECNMISAGTEKYAQDIIAKDHMTDTGMDMQNGTAWKEADGKMQLIRGQSDLAFQQEQEQFQSPSNEKKQNAPARR